MNEDNHARRVTASSLATPLNRRSMLRWAGAGGAGLLLSVRAGAGSGLAAAVPDRTAPAGPVAAITIDLVGEPKTLDPAVTYDADGWSVVHSVYDALTHYGPEGALEPLLAESVTLLDPLTYQVKLRSGIRFHNGEPLDARAVAFSLRRLQDPKLTQVADTFAVITRIEEVDPLTVRLALARPAPWLPAQLAAWGAILPPVYAGDPANDFAAKPVGTGPFRFVEWQRGQQLTLEANPDYVVASPKGRPIADRVTYRFVPDGGTRVADLRAGSSDLVRGLPVDQVEPARRGGATVTAAPVSGSAWVRIPTDVAPFSDVRVRQALNHAVDVDAIVAALLGGNGRRLPNFFVERGLGYDPALAPYAFDPDRARTLLAAAGLKGGFETSLDYTPGGADDVVQAIVGQLGDIGVRVKTRVVETAIFNGTWTDRTAAPLRFATWRPLFDPFTLLGLVVSGGGFLSRHANPNTQPLIDAGAAETDPAKRAETYRRLGKVLHDEPAALYLYNITALYGQGAKLPTWTPRPDEYVIATQRP